MPATPVPAASRDEGYARANSFQAFAIGLFVLAIGILGAFFTWPDLGREGFDAPLAELVDHSWAPPLTFAFLSLFSLVFFGYAAWARYVARRGGAYHYQLDRLAEKEARLKYNAPAEWEMLDVALRIEAEGEGQTLETIYRYLVALDEAEVTVDRAQIEAFDRKVAEMESMAEDWAREHPHDDLELSGRLYAPRMVASLARQIHAKVDKLLGQGL